MFKNYLTIALRNLWRNKSYHFINMIGLAISMACSILILSFIRDELSVNRHFSKTDRLYRVSSVWREEGMAPAITTLAPVGRTLVENYAEVINMTRLWAGRVIVNVGENSFRDVMGLVDSTFFSLFDYPVLYGDLPTALLQPNSAIITRQLAEKYFGAANVVNREIQLQTWQGEGKKTYKITGVLENLPHNTVLYDAELFVPMMNVGDFWNAQGFDTWGNRFLVTYIQLDRREHARGLQTKLASMLDKHCPPDIRADLELKLDPVSDFYLTDFNGNKKKSIRNLLALMGIIILLAAINYTNLATARSLQRAREIGLRKTLGGRRTQLIWQFISESVLLTLIALVIGLGFTELFEPLFNNLVEREPVIRASNFLVDAGWLLGIALVVGLLSGIYPAFFLSSFHPVFVLKGSLKSGRSQHVVRRALVVLQFTAAVFFFICAYAISRQLKFLTVQNLGFDRENVLVIESVPRDWTPEGIRRIEQLKQKLALQPGVGAATLAWDIPGNRGEFVALSRPGKSAPSEVEASIFRVDEDFPETFSVKIRSGRFFDKAFFHADTANSVVLNETAARALGLQTGAGQSIVVAGQSANVVGIVEDFHFEPLWQPIKPMVFLYVHGQIFRFLAIKIHARDLIGAVAAIERAWQEVFPDTPCEHSFLDQMLASNYKDSTRGMKIVSTATVFAVLIGCLGLFGLAAFSAEQRTKEIGIRKVLGASVANILFLLSKEITQLVLIAVVLASAAAYLYMRQWLADFVLRINLDLTIFLLAGLCALGIALLTVSAQAIRAALSNPVEALRYE